MSLQNLALVFAPSIFRCPEAELNVPNPTDVPTPFVNAAYERAFMVNLLQTMDPAADLGYVRRPPSSPPLIVAPAADPARSCSRSAGSFSRRALIPRSQHHLALCAVASSGVSLGHPHHLALAVGRLHRPAGQRLPRLRRAAPGSQRPTLSRLSLPLYARYATPTTVLSTPAHLALAPPCLAVSHLLHPSSARTYPTICRRAQAASLALAARPPPPAAHVDILHTLYFTHSPTWTLPELSSSCGRGRIVVLAAERRATIALSPLTAGRPHDRPSRFRPRPDRHLHQHPAPFRTPSPQPFLHADRRLPPARCVGRTRFGRSLPRRPRGPAPALRCRASAAATTASARRRPLRPSAAALRPARPGQGHVRRRVGPPGPRRRRRQAGRADGARCGASAVLACPARPPRRQPASRGLYRDHPWLTDVPCSFCPLLIALLDIPPSFVPGLVDFPCLPPPLHLTTCAQAHELDVWSATADFVDLFLPSASSASPAQPEPLRPGQYAGVLHRAGFQFEPFTLDVGALIAGSQAAAEPYVSTHQAVDASSSTADAPGRGSIPLSDPFHSAYRSVEDQSAFLADLARVYPWLATLLPLGESPEGRPLYGLRIGETPADEGQRKKEIVFLSGQHAREWIGPSTALYWAHWLLENSRAADVKPLLRNLDLTIIPNLNGVRLCACLTR